MSRALLTVEDLSVALHGVPVVEQVSFALPAGEILGLVGESGSGKSVTARAILRLDECNGACVRGRIELAGHGDLLALSEAEMHRLRGHRIALVPQDPMTSLNPVHRVGRQVAEVLVLHRGRSRAVARKEAVQALREVGLPDPTALARAWPHQLSGGMRQRVVIAMALAGEPELLIADEPTTALDPSNRRSILELFRRPCRDRGMSVLLISHDLTAVSAVCGQAAVMYGGRLVESGSGRDVLRRPAHPYTRALLNAVPRPDQGLPSPIPGEPPLPGQRPPGCPFAPRCPLAEEVCADMPGLEPRHGEGHRSACWMEEGP